MTLRLKGIGSRYRPTGLNTAAPSGMSPKRRSLLFGRELVMGDFFISTDELSERMARGEAVRVFDVRRPQALEPTSRFVAGSRWRDHMKTADWAGTIDDQSLVVVNCMHGHNVSQIAGAQLRQRGIRARVLAGGVDAWLQQGLSSVGQNELLAMDHGSPSVWVTRLGAKIDRVACPWLIRRFIDPDAQFVFVETEWVLDVAEELGGIAFDTPGAPIEHDGELCSFDTLLRAFDVRDAALDALAVVVRGADADRNDMAPEAAGLLAISLGNAARARNDDETLQWGMPVYDALYARLRLAANQTHGWQPMAS